MLTTGTFLGGVCWIGDEAMEAGRFMRQNGPVKLEPASNKLSDSIRRLGFPIGRLRTGTPPRIRR